MVTCDIKIEEFTPNGIMEKMSAAKIRAESQINEREVIMLLRGEEQQAQYISKVTNQDSGCDKDGYGPIDQITKRPYSLCNLNKAKILVQGSHGKTGNNNGRKISAKGSWERRDKEHGSNDV